MVTWVPINKDTYGAIFNEIAHVLTVFSGLTQMEGDPPRLETEWGFKTADEPLIKVVSTKKSDSQNEWESKYFIALVKREEEP